MNTTNMEWEEVITIMADGARVTVDGMKAITNTVDTQRTKEVTMDTVSTGNTPPKTTSSSKKKHRRPYPSVPSWLERRLVSCSGVRPWL